ncbi:MAG: zinc ribbon domain-containing protein [Candidatus Aenigmatarchaeota archaeon]
MENIQIFDRTYQENAPQEAQTSFQNQSYNQPSISKSEIFNKLRCIWLFLFGIVIAIIGLLCVIYRKDMGANSFIVMLIGLFLTGIGSIYGKRKLRGEMTVEPIGERPLQLHFLQQLREFGIPIEKILSGAHEQQKPSEPISQTPTQPSLSQPQPVFQQPKTQPKPIEVKEKQIIKIFLCPRCGAENEMTDRFCFKCGFNLEKVKKKRKFKKSEIKHTLKSKKIKKPTSQQFSSIKPREKVKRTYLPRTEKRKIKVTYEET